jgi:hypothetical protein
LATLQAASDDAELLLDFAQKSATGSLAASAGMADVGDPSQGSAERTHNPVSPLDLSLHSTVAEEGLPSEVRNALADILIRRLQQAKTQGSAAPGAVPELSYTVGWPQKAAASDGSQLAAEELQHALRRNAPQLARSWQHASASSAGEAVSYCVSKLWE